MKIKYEYEGHKCPFKARVWDYDDIGRSGTVVAIIEGLESPFVTANGSHYVNHWKHCEPIKEPTVKPWTPETIPSGLEVRKRDWAKGCRASILVVGKEGVAFSSGSLKLEEVSFADLLEDYEVYPSGEPCGEVQDEY